MGNAHSEIKLLRRSTPPSAPPAGTVKSKQLCRSCDLVFEMPPYQKGVKVVCPRCRTQQRSGYKVSIYDLAVVSIASVIMLFTALTLPFLSISAMGISQSMSLISIFYVLQDNWALLLYVCLLFTFLFPLGMHLIVIAHVFLRLKITPTVANLYAFCYRFAMVDVFILGVLVSLVKLVGLAEVSFHVGFFTAMVFAGLMIWCYRHGSPYRIWGLVLHHTKAGLMEAKIGVRGIDQGLIMCRHCGMVYQRVGSLSPEQKARARAQGSTNAEHATLYEGAQHCPRCGSLNDNRARHCGQKTVALLITALILYVPSNVYPIMFTGYLGSNLGSNIIDGVISLWGMGSYFVALVILVASICIPVLKILCLIALLIYAYIRPTACPSKFNKLYHLVLFIGRWSMIDVFVVIIMSTVVRITGIITIEPGIAILFFCGVVLITMLAADEFDERLIWDNLRLRHKERQQARRRPQTSAPAPAPTQRASAPAPTQRASAPAPAQRAPAPAPAVRAAPAPAQRAPAPAPAVRAAPAPALCAAPNSAGTASAAALAACRAATLVRTYQRFQALAN